MADIHYPKWIVVGFFLSVLVNLFFAYNQFVHRDVELSWSKDAAAEAERVASISCSGHGGAYVDGVLFEGEPKCECNTCYAGKDCSDFLSDCVVDANSGDPLFLEPFWMQNAASSAVVTAGWHRMSYSFDDNSVISKELDDHIRELHAVVGNAVTDGKYIIFGAGSTQLIDAAVLSLSPGGSSPPASVVASPPFYALYQGQVEFFNSTEFKWKGDASKFSNISDNSKTVIEFVTSPNNPDGKLNKPVVQGDSVKRIFDHAYYWPHFSAIPNASDEDLMIFTLSKLTGHAGSRFGWALVKDEDVYNKMNMFITLNSMSVSRDTQLRALKILKVALKNRGRDMFNYGYGKMKRRWERISKSFASSKRFSLQELEPQYCTYFQNVTGPSPAYAWVKCERLEDEDCNAVFERAGVTGRGGSKFSVETRYTRFSLIRSDDDFDLLLQKVDALISSEGVAIS